MANDISKAGSESEPAAPNQTPFSGFPGYENFRVGDPIPGMPGTRVGDEIVNNAGDRWNWLKGDWDYAGSTTEPPPIDLSNVATLNIPKVIPQTPSYIPQAAPPAVTVEPQSPFPPVRNVLDPAQLILNQPPIQIPMYTPMAAPAPVRVEPPAAPRPMTTADTGGLPYEPTPGYDPLNRGGDRYGRPIPPAQPIENEPAAPPQERVVPTEPVVEKLTPGEVAQITEGQTPSTPGEGTVVTPGQTREILPDFSQIKTPDITVSGPVWPTTPTYTQVPYTGGVGGNRLNIFSSGRTTPFKEPVTVPIPARRQTPYAPTKYDYIQYDPEMILEAAMRAMGNSRIRQSIADESLQNRMFARMR